METVRHYAFAGNRLFFAAGLVRRVRRYLERHGYIVEIDDGTHWGHLHNADRHLLEDPGLATDEIRFLAVLAEQPRGQVSVRRFSHVGRHIALFARLFHNFSIYVVARSKKRVRQLVDAIGQHTDRPVTSDTRAVWKHHPRLFVGTTQLFHGSSSEGFHNVIFTDVESVLAARTKEIAENWPDGAFYALFAASGGLTDYDQFRLEEICGPVIFSPSNSNPQLKVNVVVLDVKRDTTTIISARHSGLARKREMIWYSPSWNGMVTRTAAALTGNGGERTVSILVESTEHGRELLKSLPGWELLTANSFTTCIPAAAHQQIATFAYAERWGINTDVLIRGDGGNGWPLTSGFPRQAQGEDESVFVLDFNDTADGTAGRDTQSRHGAYGRLGWDVLKAESGQLEVGVEGGDGHPADGDSPLNPARWHDSRRGVIRTGQNVRTSH